MPVLALIERFESYLRWRRGAELDGIADKILKKPDQLAGVGVYRRHRPTADLCAALFDGHAEVRERSGERCFGVRRSEFGAPRGHPRVRQQVADKLLHALGPIDGESDEVVGIGTQLSLVALGQKLRVAGHHAQRLLKSWEAT